MPREIWIPVPGYEGHYEVSSLGKVRSLDRLVTTKDNKVKHIRGKILVGCISDTHQNDEYLSVELWKGGELKSVSVHRIVALAFLPNPENKPTVNHKDGNKHNNCIDNLEWATFSENNKHAYETGLNKTDPNKSGATVKSNEATRKSIYCVETDTKYISRAECARRLGIWPSSIFDSISHGGRRVRCGNRYYTFKEVEEIA